MNITRMRSSYYKLSAETSELSNWNAEFVMQMYDKYKDDDFNDQILLNIVFHFNTGKCS